MQLSKSDFLKYQICPSYLWLWKHKRDVVPVDEEEVVKRRLEQGNEVERYARQLFPEAKLIESSGITAKRDTERLVSEGETTIFQATVITDDGLLAMADVIVYDTDSKSWTLLEVKSTNSVKQEHIYDVAFQQVAFEEAGYKIGQTGVIHLNKEYLRQPTIIASDFLIQTDVTTRVDEVLETIRGQAHDSLRSITDTPEPKTCSCRLQSKSHHCPTFYLLNPDIPEYSVFNITRMSGKKLAALVDEEIFKVHEVPEDIKLSLPQQNQVDAAKSGNSIIDNKAIADILDELVFPLYFLDYETVSTAVPFYSGCTPYQQIPFQYSLHVLRAPDGELEHYEYLSEDAKTLPAQSLLESLKKLIGAEGSVIVWHKSFEIGRNREMATTYPEYGDFMSGVNDRVFDLKEVFSKQHFVHPKFKGSNSIKAVLPVLVPELSYKEMDIQNGQIASVRWYDATSGAVSADVARKVYDDLIKYCCLDTLAMVEIYKVLAQIAQDKT